MNIASILATKSGQVITIRPERSVREAVVLLGKHNAGALVVVTEVDRPVGIISERDIVREAARNEHVFTRTVSELMTKDVITGLPQDDLIPVANTMTQKRIRHLPIVDKGKLVGIVSLGDVVKAHKLLHARAVLEQLRQRVESGSTAVEWQKGYVKALEEVLDLDDLDDLSLRRHPRWETDIPTQIARIVAKQEAPGRIVDLSVGGCGLVTVMELSAGEVIQLSFKPPDRNMIVTLEGVVRRVVAVDNEYKAGVEFIGRPAGIAEALGVTVALWRSWLLINPEERRAPGGK